MAIQKITSGIIADGAIVATDIADGTVTGPKLGAAAINANNIASNTISNTNIQTGAVENYIAATGRPLTNRNIIINGAMQVAQRNTSNTGVTTGGYYTADRWWFLPNSLGTWTMNVDSSGPTNSEFTKSANVIVTTANTSPGTSGYALIYQAIEGQNVQSIKKGKTNAESITLSFWVKSSNTGTFVTEAFDTDNTRQVSKSFTVNAVDTWEKKSLTFPADTTGTFNNDNGESLRIYFWLAAGTNFTSGTLNDTAWASNTNANRVVGQLNLANRAGNYFAFTGVQLETGTVATPYEWLDYGVELLKCQRYYERICEKGSDRGVATAVWNGTSSVNAGIMFVQKRVNPTMFYDGTFTVLQAGATWSAVSSISIDMAGKNSCRLIFSSSGGTNGQGSLLRPTDGFIALDSEL